MEKHSKIVIVGLVISALATLSACGGGGTRAITTEPVTPDPVTPEPVTPEPATYASNATDTIATRATMAAASGEAVVLSVTNSKNLNYGAFSDPTVSDDAANISLTYGSVTSSVDASITNVVNSIKLETGGSSSLTFGREQLEFEGKEFVQRSPDGEYLASIWVSTNDGHWDDYANGAGEYQFMIPVRWYIDNNGSSLWGHGVIGHETTAATVSARTGTASYSGQLFGNSATTETERNLGKETYANVSLNVDFAEGQINNGEIGQFLPINTILAIGASAISGNGFDSSLSCVAAQCAGGMIAAGSSFAGRFYGDAAQEAGGTASWSWQRGASSDEGVESHTVGAVWAARATGGQ